MIISDLGKENQIVVPEILKGSMTINGSSNDVFIHETISATSDITLNLTGERNRVFIDSGCRIRAKIFVRGSDCEIHIGRSTAIVGCRIEMGESTSLHIGRGCLFSRNIEIRTYDAHPIYCRHSRQQINIGRSVDIGDHVWLGEGVTINKGASVPKGCVIGSRSLVSKKLDTANSIYAGIPAVQIRSNIVWSGTKGKVDWNWDGNDPYSASDLA